MKYSHFFSRLLVAFGFILSIALSGWSADQCSSVTDSHSFTETSPNNYYEQIYNNNSFDNNENRYFYLSVPTAGTLTFHHTSSASVAYAYNLNGCTTFPTTLNDGSTIHLTSDTDLNLRLHASANNQHYNFNFTFVPDQLPPVMGDIPNQVITIGSIFSLNIASYVTLTNVDPITVYTLSGVLPAGLSFNSTTGVISGTPTAVTSAVTFTVTATDNDGVSNSDTFTISVVAEPVANSGYRDFSLRKQLYVKGNMKTIGNTVLVAPNNSDSNNYCNTYTNGAYLADAGNSNDSYYLCGYHSDLVNSGVFSNSTTSELNIPKGSKVIWAGLYWQAIVSGNVNTNMTIKLRKDGDNYVDVIPTKLNYNNTTSYTTSGGSATSNYAAFADVTQYFGEGKWNDGNYTVANIPVYEGKIGSLGTYGAWSLVTIYEDTTTVGEKFRSFSIFDGWKAVNSSASAVPVNVSGFYTPNRSNISAKVSVFAAEGDKYISNDHFNTTNYNTGASVTMEASPNNSFNSSISGGGVRTPYAINNNGIDIQTYDIGSYLKPQQTDMTFTFTSDQDAYWPSMLAFSTELVTPQLCYDYSFKQDGHYLKADNNGSQLPLLSGYISESPIESAVYLRNNEADIKAQGVSFYSSVNTSLFKYIQGTTQTSNINGSEYIARTDTITGTCNYTDSATTPIGCSDGSNIRIGLGSGATGYSEYSAGSMGNREFVYAKFNLDPIGVNGIKDVNTSLGLHLNYYIIPKTGASPIPYDYQFGVDIPMCPPSSGYQPTWGIFNIVDHAASNVGGLPANNLRTQVSRKPFAVDVATYEKNTDGKYTKVPTIDMNTTVLVEVIDNDAFHDTNASCANPGSVITPPIYVRIANTSKDMTVDIPIQNALYHNFAVKNAAYRMWYFDQNQSLINWTATTSDTTRRSLTSIRNLYKSNYHTACTSSCTSATSTTCFDCIKTNYARPLCSRDNFSVRPESYDLRIYDIDHNAALAQRNSTKIDLSTLFQYAPIYSAAKSRINLAAGYNYRYDLNATGNDTTLSAVPGYTRYFNGPSSDYNATMIWDPQTLKSGCNDIAGKTFKFYVANGQMINTEQNQTQVGEYRLNIIDPAWTAADWSTLLTGHHTTTNGFELTKEDCLFGSDSTTASNGKVGCTTTSAHSGGGYTYKDHNLRYKPAKFDLNGVAYGIGKTPLFIGEGGRGFVYNSDLNITNDMAMSVRAFGPIKAVGYGGETLSNFVKDCYATDLNISITHDVNATRPFSGRMTIAESNGTQIYDSLKFSAPKKAVQTLQNVYFSKGANGQSFPTIRLNFDRNATTPLPPKIVRYTDMNVSCLLASDCNLSAAYNTTPNTAKGYDKMDFNVTHVYGRLIPRDIVVTWLQPFNELAKYEIYQTSNLLGTALSPDQFDSDWYVNVLHTDSNYGDSNVTVIDPQTGSSLPTLSNSVNGIETYAFAPFTVKQGYKAHIDTDGWLWYGGVNALKYSDPNGPTQAGSDNLNCLTHPCFNISLGRIFGNTGSAKTGSETNKANKKTTSTGWSTTSEYAPSVR